MCSFFNYIRIVSEAIDRAWSHVISHSPLEIRNVEVNRATLVKNGITMIKIRTLPSAFELGVVLILCIRIVPQDPN